MAFYENRREHYGGALVLFQRNLAVAVPNAKTHRQPTRYMRLKIGGRKGYITRSTKDVQGALVALKAAAEAGELDEAIESMMKNRGRKAA